MNQVYFIDYGVDATWTGLDKAALCEEEQANFLTDIWLKFGSFQAHYQAWYTCIDNINKDRANVD